MAASQDPLRGVIANGWPLMPPNPVKITELTEGRVSTVPANIVGQQAEVSLATMGAVCRSRKLSMP